MVSPSAPARLALNRDCSLGWEVRFRAGPGVTWQVLVIRMVWGLPVRAPSGE
jgi:hypothetical protein